jgi:hypothetical protein
MPIITIGQTGLETITVIPELAIDHSLGGLDDLDFRSFWTAVPDDLSLLQIRDQQIIEAAWASLLASFSAELVDSLRIQSTSSILEFPVFRERKWVAFEIEKSFVDFRTIPDGLFLEYAESKDVSLDGSSTVSWLAGSNRTAVVYPFVSAAQSDTFLRSTLTFSLLPSSNEGVCALWCADLVGAGVGFMVRTNGDTYFLGPNGKTQFLFTIPNVTEEFSLLTSCWPSQNGSYFRCEASGLQAEVFVSDIVSVRYFTVGPPSFKDTAGRNLPSVEARAKTSIQLNSMTVYDPSVPNSVRSIPLIQTNVVDTTGAFRFGLEFDLGQIEKDVYLRTRDPLPARAWAESVAVDDRLLQKLWAPFTGMAEYLPEEDSAAHKHMIACVLYALVKGPSPAALSTAVTALTGGAVALEPGTVVSLRDPQGDAAIGIIGPKGIRYYPYSSDLELKVAVGDTVSAFQNLTIGATVHDVWSGASYLDAVVDSDIERFGSVLVRYQDVPSNNMDQQLMQDRITALMQQAVSVWVGVKNLFIQAIRQLSDNLEIEDDCRYVGILGETSQRWSIQYLFSAFSERGEPMMYNRTEGAYAASGFNPPYYDEDLALLNLPDRLVITYTNESTGPQTIEWEGEEYTVPASGSVVLTQSTPAREFPVSFPITNDGEGALELTFDGAEYTIEPGDTVTVETWSSTPSGTVPLVITNPTSSEITVVVDGIEYTVAAFSEETIEVAYAITPTP